MKRCKFNLSISLAIAAVNLVVWRPGYAQEPEISAGEDKVKASIEKVAVKYVCSEPALLENDEILPGWCQIGVSTAADACWTMIDKLVPDYRVTGSEQATERYSNITDVFIHCVQAKVLLTLIRSRADHK